MSNKRIPGFLVLGLFGSLSFATANTTLYGVRFSGELFRVNPDTSESVTVGQTGLLGPNALALSPGGALYACNFSGTRRFVRIDMGSGASTNIVASGFADIRDMAFAGSTLYGIQDGGAGSDVLVTIDPNTGAVTTIGNMGSTAFQGLCALGSGLYASASGIGLCSVNTATGAATDVNASQVGPLMQGLAFAADGVMYGCNTSGILYRVNHRTGESVAVSTVAGDLRALAPMPRSYRVLLRRANIGLGDFSWRLLDTGTMEVSSLASGSGASDAGTGLTHGLNRVGSGSTMVAVDPGSGIDTFIASFGRLYEGLAYDGSLMYGVSDQGNSILYRVDTNTGSSIPMGNTGFTSVQGLAFVGGQLYGWDTVAGLIRISTGTGAGTDVSALIGGSANIRSLEAMPNGELLGFGDQVYVLNTTTGAFEARGGSWGGVMMGSSSLITDNADFIGLAGSGAGYTVTRTGAQTFLGWSTGLTNWGGARFGDDGYLYISNRATSQLLTVDPATGALTFVANTGGIVGGLGWYRPSAVPSDADSVAQGGDLYMTLGSNLRRFNPITSGWDTIQSLGYSSSDIAAFSNGRMFLGSAVGNWQRLDSPAAASFDLGSPTAPNYNGLETLPDGTLYGTRGTGGGSGDWYVIDPITGTFTTTPTSFPMKGLAYVGARLFASLTLGDYVGDPRLQTITVEYRHRGSSTPVEVRKVRLGISQTFHVATLQRGGYDVTVKGSHWLRKLLSPTMVSNGLALGFGTLTNGDVDDDNEVGIGDYAGLSAAYGSIPGDPNWLPNADLNGDDSVDIADYAILSANYGEAGD